MAEFQAMQRYVAKCAGGEWDDHDSWAYDRGIVDACHYTGLEDFLKMKFHDDALTPEELQDMSVSLLWLVAMPKFQDGLEGVAIRTRIREFARDCREDSKP